jgi:hypothetical protein
MQVEWLFWLGSSTSLVCLDLEAVYNRTVVAMLASELGSSIGLGCEDVCLCGPRGLQSIPLLHSMIAFLVDSMHVHHGTCGVPIALASIVLEVVCVWGLLCQPVRSHQQRWHRAVV